MNLRWFLRNRYGTFDTVGWEHPPHQFIPCLKFIHKRRISHWTPDLALAISTLGIPA